MTSLRNPEGTGERRDIRKPTAGISSAVHGALKVGREASFIRWLNGRDGWTSETVRGVYLRATSGNWVVETSAGVTELSRDEWEVFS